MKQRAAVARTLAIDPQILLMDEPFGALDAQTRSLMQSELLNILQRSRKTVIFVTHDVHEAVFLAERIAVMSARPGHIKEIAITASARTTFQIWSAISTKAGLRESPGSPCRTASQQVTATVVATQGVEKELVWSARSLGAGERQLLWEVVLPEALPQILTGLQVALPISLIVAIVTEMLMGGTGLGAAMINASRFADSPGVFASIVEIGVAGFWSRGSPRCAGICCGGIRKHKSRQRYKLSR